MKDWNGLPEAASTLAADIDALYDFILLLSIGSMALITGAMLFMVIKYRRKNDDEIPENPVTHNVPLEVAWIVIPTLLLIVVFAWGFTTWLDARVPPAEPIDIRVEARQWAWSFTYPEEGIVSEHLVVPAGKPVKLTMSSADVLHSLFVPAFRIKQDVLPERYTIAWFNAPETGEYDLLCAEYCGKDHSRMNRLVKVMNDKDYIDWIDSGGGMKGLSIAERGGMLFTRFGCTQCHSIDGTAGTGPTLAGLYGKQESLVTGEKVLADDNYIRESILYPNRKIVAGYEPKMPAYAGSIRDAQIEALIEYIKSLATVEPSP